ncbi:hypothetical protein BH24ACT5_BH24ACT5_24100 [soil metagenome]
MAAPIGTPSYTESPMRIDRDLIARLGTSAAAVEVATAAAYVALDPADPARTQAFGRGAAVALGPRRWVNRALGVDVDALDDDAFDQLESFFERSATPSALEVSSWTGPDTLQGLGRRGYRSQWFRALFVRDTATPGRDPRRSRGDVPGIVPVGDDDIDEWGAVFVAGFAIADADMAMVRTHVRAVAGADGARHFVARVDGQAAACGSLHESAGIGWLGGAATRPEVRGAGHQRELIDHRIGQARERGLDLVAATALVGGASARNLCRAGFEQVDTQVVMARPE